LKLKLKKIFILNLIMILLLSGCAKQSDAENADATNMTTTTTTDTDETIAESVEEPEPESEIEFDGFMFIYDGTPIYLDEEAGHILTALVSPADFYEYEEGCGSAGMMNIIKKYMYDEFDLVTRIKEKDDKERVYSIELYDESISTAEGLRIGQTYEDMIAVYGADYQERQGFAKIYSYTKGDTFLSFGIKDNIIIQILYEIENIYLSN